MSIAESISNPPTSKKEGMIIVGVFILGLFGMFLLNVISEKAAKNNVPKLERIVDVSQTRIRDYYKGNYSGLDNRQLRKLSFKTDNNEEANSNGAIVVDGMSSQITASPVLSGLGFAITIEGLTDNECQLLAANVLNSKTIKNSSVEVDGQVVSKDTRPNCIDRRSVLRILST